MDEKELNARELFPTAGYDPHPGHATCNGKGMYKVRGHWSPCICIYMSPELLNITEPAMDKAFRDVLGEHYDQE